MDNEGRLFMRLLDANYQTLFGVIILLLFALLGFVAACFWVSTSCGSDTGAEQLEQVHGRVPPVGVCTACRLPNLGFIQPGLNAVLQ